MQVSVGWTTVAQCTGATTFLRSWLCASPAAGCPGLVLCCAVLQVRRPAACSPEPTIPHLPLLYTPNMCCSMNTDSNFATRCCVVIHPCLPSVCPVRGWLQCIWLGAAPCHAACVPAVLLPAGMRSGWLELLQASTKLWERQQELAASWQHCRFVRRGQNDSEGKLCM